MESGRTGPTGVSAPAVLQSNSEFLEEFLFLSLLELPFLGSEKLYFLFRENRLLFVSLIKEK